MSGELEGRKALVTGSSAGIGEATARRLAREGAAVAVHGRNRERAEKVAAEIRAAGGHAIVAIGDLKDPAQSAEVCAIVGKEFGDIDILVNNAGGESSGMGTGPWFETSPEQWESTYRANVVSIVRMIQHFVPGMKRKGWGRIVQVSSASAYHAWPQIPDYQAAKSGLSNLTRSLVMALANTGITANTVTPGFILTETNKGWLKTMGKARGWDVEDFDALLKRVITEWMPTPSGRVGVPDDVAQAIAFLVSPASGHINGVNIPVTGGSLMLAGA
ncbi:MAG TPA: SDR family NAD(P)-dependent oxidoreductase [Alphaproteobacteria bacterium]|nr:SDR family NAD(P)-dependent oxidoreductase [Alphaproteobacteria bacterium]